MKFPSLNNLSLTLFETIKRFPIPVLFALLGTADAFCGTSDYLRDFFGEVFLLRFFFLCLMAFPTFFSAKIFKENSASALHINIFYALSFMFLSWFYYQLPDKIEQKDTVKIVVIIVALHMLVAVVAHIKNKNDNGFWQYNKYLFLRFLTTTLYTVVLYAGVSIALVAIENLFGIDMKDKVYARLFIFFAGTFHTLFFLSGIPKNIEQLNDEDNYPKGLKIFTQFVLLPLVTLYLCILYMYMFKVVINLFADKGIDKLWTSWLVLSFSIAGILALLLLHPLKKFEENKWINIFSKRFYLAILPLAVFQIWSILVRVSNYGITVNRYYILLLSFWLLSMALYFLFSKQKNIRYIPLTLFFIGFASIYSPLSSFKIAAKSQLSILENIFNRNNFKSDSKQDIDASKLSNIDNEKVESIIRYIDNFHNLNALQPWFKTNLDSLFAAEKIAYNYANNDNALFELMHLNRTTASYQDNYFTIYAKRKNVVNTNNYNYSIFLNNQNIGYDDAIFQKEFVGNDSIYFKQNSDTKDLLFFKNTRLLISIPLQKNVIEMMRVGEHLQRGNIELSNDKLIYVYESKHLKCKTVYQKIYGNMQNNEPNINQIELYFLFSFK